MIKRESMITIGGVALALLFLTLVIYSRLHSIIAARSVDFKRDTRPNFLIVVSDDQSWVHTSYNHFPQIKTPGFDQIARHGLYFRNGYASAPTCTASRSALLSGGQFWQTGTGADLWGIYPANIPDFQTILKQHGYAIGYTGKGWGPGEPAHPGQNPAGPTYNQRKDRSPKGISNNNYSDNFRQFLHHRRPGQPFSFLFTPWEPHRPYGPYLPPRIHPAKVRVPPFLPDVPVIRRDIAHYLFEIEWYDRHLVSMLAQLKRHHLLRNTIVIVTSDNGMPFPRAKANNYEYGVHVPLAVMWQAKGVSGPPRNEFINLSDIAPTVLQAAGIKPPPFMTGRSFLPVLLGKKINPKAWSFTVTGMERHMPCRPNGAGYPMRAIHTEKYVYILNLKPDRWPAGNPPYYCDIDGTSPTKTFLLHNQTEFANYMVLATAKRPAAELYLRQSDPGNINNLIDDPRYHKIASELHKKLITFLKKTHDPRFTGRPDAFWNIPYYGPLSTKLKRAYHLSP